MSQIKVTNLTFSYEKSYDKIFDHTSFLIDTDWKLGFIGRNGKGKTTFLNLLMGKYEYTGTIKTSVRFSYFPYDICEKGQDSLSVMKQMIAPFEQWEKEMESCLFENTPESLERYGEIQEQYLRNDGYWVEDYIHIELGKLGVKEDVLTRPFHSLSNGEQTKLMLAALFLRKNNFLLIDEPTNHLDIEGRKLLSSYLKGKKSFLLVSHDREFLDGCIDHVLSINRSTIEIQRGNYTSWSQNKMQRDQYEIGRNEKLKKEISHLQTASRRTANWSDQVESSRIGNKPADRGRIGHLAAKMMKRSKAIEKRQSDVISQKQELLKDVETAEELKMNLLKPDGKKLVEIKGLSIFYGAFQVNKPADFIIHEGDRIALTGRNGCGKTSLIKAILGDLSGYKGLLWKANNLKISYVSQDTSFLEGSLKAFAEKEGLNVSLFLTVLRRLYMPRQQFEKNMEYFSEGQKKRFYWQRALLSRPIFLFGMSRSIILMSYPAFN